MAERNDKGQFVAGQSGNPGGQPKNPEWKRLLEERTPWAINRLFEFAADDRPSIAMRALETLLSYALPKPKQEQSIELTGQNGGAIGIDASRRETREEWLARRAKLNANGVNGVHNATNGAATPRE